jgi:hypothetical protein
MFTTSRSSKLLQGVIVAIGIAIWPLSATFGADETHAATPDGVRVPHFGAAKIGACGHRTGDRVAALMAGAPWVQFDRRPSAKNRLCK